MNSEGTIYCVKDCFSSKLVDDFVKEFDVVVIFFFSFLAVIFIVHGISYYL